MPILKSSSALWHPRLLTYEQIQEAWGSNTGRLYNFLGLKLDRSTRGICCPFCNSGTGDRGTGMSEYDAPNGYVRLKCFASNCEVNLSPFDLVMRLHPDAYDFPSAMDLLSDLYAPETSEYDSKLQRCTIRSRNPMQKLIPEEIVPVHADSIKARQSCPLWQHRLASLLRLPVSVFNRPDIGKSFEISPTGVSDAHDNDCGHMVTYNLVDGIPQCLKVRYTPGLYCSKGIMHYYDPKRASFIRIALHNTDAHHDFRMAGPSGQVCFGHDFIRDAELVVIVEGQSDVLATVAAFQACGKHSYTAIGRDSSGHVLKDIDLSVLAGKRVIYASDFDTIGSDIDRQNYALLENAGCSIQRWSAPSADAKDPRAVYINAGPGELVNSLLSAPSLSSLK